MPTYGQQNLLPSIGGPESEMIAKKNSFSNGTAKPNET